MDAFLPALNRSLRKSRALALACAGIACGILVVELSLDAARAAPFVELGVADGLALDQPRVAVELLTRPTTGAPQSIGPEFSNTFLLDTGATTILAVGSAVNELNAAGYQTVAKYDEQGVAGFTETDVSAEYTLDYAGTDGLRQSIGPVRLLSSAELNFGSFSGIAGMPLMVGRTTTVDMTGWADGSSLTLGVSFPTAPPAPSATLYEVPLTLIDFPLTGQRNPTDPLPTDAPLPYAPVQMRHGNKTVEQQFVVDTGAQLSIISTATALALGLDTDGDGSFDAEKVGELPVGGIGGEVLMPLLNIDAIGLQTTSGTDLVWTTLTLGVRDVDPSIGGVVGMDLLTSGWFEKVFNGTGPNGFISKIHFDFRNAASYEGSMWLDINPVLNVIQFPEPWQNPLIPTDVDASGATVALDALIVINDLNSKGPRALPPPGATGGPPPYIDVNGDNSVSALDALVVINEINRQERASLVAVPEPATGVLALFGLMVIGFAGVRKFRRQAS